MRQREAFTYCQGEEFLVKPWSRAPNYTVEADVYLKASGYTYLTSTYLYEDEDRPSTESM